MNDRTSFAESFRALTGNEPFRWQERLFQEFIAGRLPSAIDLPTGLGKTSVMAIWLIALALADDAFREKFPRRLVYVVNRRTVVDQATDVAIRLREKLRATGDDGSLRHLRDTLANLCIDPEDDASPLAISTLRGELADNRQWQSDPARPAIIIGTIDMIGSRLLFSGYGVSRRMRPFHAGLLGHDALLVHDEAHLTPAFGKLAREVARCQKEQKAPRPLIVMELSATRRDYDDDGQVFTLTNAEKAEPVVASRLHARKCLRFLEAGEDDNSGAIARLADCAREYKDQRKRILIYVRKPSDAKAIADNLADTVGNERIALLTGTIRGHERDILAKKPLLKGFHADPDRGPPVATEYLVSTSAGEVGADLDADHMVCDLSTLDSMIQRLGRVNRLGDREADVHVLELLAKERKKEGESDLEKRIAATKQVFASLPELDGGRNGSPEALHTLAASTEAFAREPRIAPLTDILIDNWSLTRVDDLPGRPLPERWLHGLETGEPDLVVAWRAEVNDVIASDRDRNRVVEAARGVLKALYDKHPILARERVRGPLHEVKTELERVAKRAKKQSGEGAPLKAVLLPVHGNPIAGELSVLLEDEDRLPNATIVLPPEAGGLDARGMLDGGKTDPVLDVADERPLIDARSRQMVASEHRRKRVLHQLNDETGEWSVRLFGQNVEFDEELNRKLAACNTYRQSAKVAREYFGLAQKALLILNNDEDGQPTAVLQILGAPRSVETAQEDPAASARSQDLEDHLVWAAEAAQKIVECCGLRAAAPEIAEAVIIAARWHDRGKHRAAWQKAIGNPNLAKPWAKSGQRGFDDSACGRYRHEFGSLREAAVAESIDKHPERDLILHLIAAHHGWARPHFKPDQWDIADGVSEEENAAVAAETMRRFARLQRRFGHWGLAWLEALVRAADYAATERLSSGPSAISRESA